MNASVISWISEQGFDSGMLMDQRDFMDTFDEDFSALMGTSSVPSSSTAIDVTAMEPFNYSTFSPLHNTMDVLDHFGNLNPSANVQQVNPIEEVVVPQVFTSIHNANFEEAPEKARPTKKKRIRPPSQTHDHIMAERRRREQLSQLFVALSALIPGLKKMDKGSILEDAIKYMKNLQDRVKLLEKKKAMKPVVVVRKSQIVVDDDEGVCDEESSSSAEQPLPEIEARVCDNQILLKVLCEKKSDALAKLICKVESLNMIIVTTNATSFGDVALEITIVAEMEKEFNLTVKEVLAALRAALRPTA